MQSIINFIKYHNLVPIILGVVLIATAGAFANEDVRDTVIGQEIITEQGIDNSQILVADLDNFDMALQITNVTEDNEKYYIDYTYKTIAIQDNSWQEVWKEKRLAVSKKNLGDEDLTLYVTKELSQVVDNELAYLKEVQEIEKEKGLQKIVASVEYTGLRGLLSDLQEKIASEPVCQPMDEVCDAVDNDCDGLVDEDLGQTTCGVGVCEVTVDNCLNGALIVCVPATPGEEMCDDGVDNDCDGIVNNPEICQPQPAAEEEPICQPTTEICDGIDNDCDGLVDEDNVCQPVCQPTIEICDGIDNDCNGLIDEDLIQQCGTTDVGACQFGIQTCSNGVWGECFGAVIPTEEICDQIDNDCDGEVDEGGVCGLAEPPAEDVCDATHLNLCLAETDCLNAAGFWYNEGCNTEPEAPAEPEEPVCNSEHLDLCTTQELCEEAVLYWYNETCNTEPEAPVCTPSEEICNGIDNDCDGEIDEDLTVYSGIDEGECQQGITECIDGQMVETQIEIGPTEEICDGLDNDCDGQVDEDLGQTTCGVGACEVTIDICLDGVSQTCISGVSTDEICDGIDNDCDDQIDEGGICETPEEPEE